MWHRAVWYMDTIISEGTGFFICNFEYTYTASCFTGHCYISDIRSQVFIHKTHKCNIFFCFLTGNICFLMPFDSMRNLRNRRHSSNFESRLDHSQDQTSMAVIRLKCCGNMLSRPHAGASFFNDPILSTVTLPASCFTYQYITARGT